MKTIEKRAEKWVRNIPKSEDTMNGIRNIVKLSYMRGAQDEHKKLTRWHNPAKTLPEPLKDVLVKCSDGTYLVDMFIPTHEMFHCEVTLYMEVIGWREIHK
ncbi:MAG: hypothetical protein NC209_04090 [Alistipes sp.]|nr:hypothetical protein [Lachnospiraceae bacterium]MCM1250310.1 hypothetical protein [Alistipes sp.]